MASTTLPLRLKAEALHAWAHHVSESTASDMAPNITPQSLHSLALSFIPFADLSIADELKDSLSRLDLSLEMMSDDDDDNEDSMVIEGEEGSCSDLELDMQLDVHLELDSGSSEKDTDSDMSEGDEDGDSEMSEEEDGGGEDVEMIL